MVIGTTMKEYLIKLPAKATAPSSFGERTVKSKTQAVANQGSFQRSPA